MSAMFACPLCGSAPVLEHHSLGCQISCLRCYDPGDDEGCGFVPAGVARLTEEEAIAAWNEWVVESWLGEDDGLERIGLLVEEHAPRGFSDADAQSLGDVMRLLCETAPELGALVARGNSDKLRDALVSRFAARRAA